MKNAVKDFRAAAWASQDAVRAFVDEMGELPAAELQRLLAVLVEPVSDARAHRTRCVVFGVLVERAPDPELFLPFVRALKPADATLRAALVKLLPMVNRVAGHGALCAALGEQELALRAAVAEVLQSIFTKTTLDALQALVLQPQFAGRAEAREVAVPRAGHHALPVLGGVLAAGSPSERTLALRWAGDLQLMGRDPDAAAALAQTALDDRSELVASAAIAALAALCDGEDTFVAALGEHLDTVRPGPLTALADALRGFTSKRLEPLLERRFREGPGLVRVAVLDALEKGQGEGMALLAEALGHKHVAVRNRAMDTLVSLATRQAVDPARAIVWLLRSRDVNVRRAAVEIANRVGDPNGDLAPRLLKFLRDEDWWVRERVMDVLTEMAGTSLTRHLAEYLSDPSDVVRRYAIGALVRIKDPRAVGALLRTATNDDDWWVREEAITAVGAIGDPRGVPYLVQMLQTQPETREVCIGALSAMKAKESAEAVSECLQDPSADVRLAAVHALDAFDDRETALWLSACEGDASAEVRFAAKEVLARWASVDQGRSTADALLSPLDRWLVRTVDAGADDLFLCTGRVPYVKRMGQMAAVGKALLTPDEIEVLLLTHLTPAQRGAVEAGREIDFSHDVRGRGLRFRAHVFRQRTGLAGVFRVIRNKILTVAEIGVPATVAAFGDLRTGLVLVGGPTGSGKSTTLASLIDHMNRTSDRHIVTIEDPIEVVHVRTRCLVNQREVGTHTPTFEAALRATLRQDPDVILVGELRDMATIAFAVAAAETGHLVFGTVHTNSADTTVDRLVNAFPPRQQGQVRSSLAESLRAVVCQHLLRRRDGSGRVLATEVMLNNDAVANLIRKGKTFQIPSVIATSKDLGMQSMDADLARLVRDGVIEADDGYVKANDKKTFASLAGLPEYAARAVAEAKPAAAAG